MHKALAMAGLAGLCAVLVFVMVNMTAEAFNCHLLPSDPWLGRAMVVALWCAIVGLAGGFWWVMKEG